MVVTAVGSATLVALIYAIENRRGRAAWAEAQAEARAAGFPLLPSVAMPLRGPEAEALAAAPELRGLFAEAAQAAAAERRVTWINETPFARVLERPQGGTAAEDSESASAYGWESRGLRSLTEWRFRLGAEDLRAQLAPIEADLAAVTTASRRARFFGGTPDGIGVDWAMFAFRHAAQALVLRARVRLEAGEASAAAEDLAAALRLAGIFSNDGSMIGPIFGGQIAGWATQALREGLSAGAWQDAEVAWLAEAAARVDMFEVARQVARLEVVLKVSKMRGFVERPGAVEEYFRDGAKWVPFEFSPSDWWPVSARGQWFAGSPESGAQANRLLWEKLGPERGLALMPSGWWHQVTAAVLRSDRALLGRIFDVDTRRVPDPTALFRAGADRAEGGWTPYRAVEAYLALRGYTLQNAVFAQVEIDLARTALELERWRGRHGVYPADLGELEAAAFMLTLVAPLLGRLPAGEGAAKALVLAVPFAANIGGLGTPIASPPNAIALG